MTTLAPEPIIHAGPILIDTATRIVTVHDQPVEQLTRKEWQVLLALARAGSDGRAVVDRPTLLRAIWGPHASATRIRTLDSHACRLRAKLTAGMSGGQGLVVNIWAVGYALVRPQAVTA